MGSPRIEVRAALDSEEYISGEPIVLDVTFLNPTNHAFTSSGRTDSEDATGGVNFHWDWSDLEWVLKAELAGPDGETRRWYKRSVIPSAADQIILPFVVLPKERTPTARVILSRVFQQLPPGEHHLTWSIDMPCRAVDVRSQRLDTPLTLRATGSGTAAFRVMEADLPKLRKHAGELLRRWQGEDSRAGHSFPLQLLATMPPSIALPRFQEYLGPVHRYGDKEEGHRDVEAALRGLIYIESPRAVDLIADIAAAQRSENGKRPPNHEYRGYIHWRALTALSDMYYTTRREDVKQRIRERWKR